MLFFLSGAIVFLLFISQLLLKPTKFWKEDGMGSHGPGSRRLGNFEELFASKTEAGYGNISTIIFIRSKFPLTEDMIRKALRALSQRHPLLRMRLGKESEQFTYMKEMKDIIVDLKVCHTDNWQGLVEDQLLKIFDAENGPLWNVTFIPQTFYEDGEQDGYPYQSACVFAFHHIIADGPSFLRLFGEFVDQLHEIPDAIGAAVGSKPLLPPMDAYIDSANIYSPKFNTRANILDFMSRLPSSATILDFVFKTIFKPAIFVKTHGVEINRDSTTARKTCLIPVELTQEQTSLLLTSCRKHNTTVQCAIQTAACLSYCGMVNEGKGQHARKLDCRITCDARRYFTLTEPADSFGFNVLLLTMATEVQPTLPFWDIVAKVTTELHGKLKAHAPFLFYRLIVNTFRSESDWATFKKANARIPGGRNLDLSFNNYGNFNSLNRDMTRNVKISGYFGGVAEHEEGPVFDNMLATLNNKLSWTLQYFPHVCSKDQAQRYADGTIDTLLKAIQE